MEKKSSEECIEIINVYEPETFYKQNKQLSFHGFVNYMNDEKQFISKPRASQVYQNMNLPIFSYFVNSSHNTFGICFF